MAEENARVSVEIRDHVAHVTLTRPDKRNAYDDARPDGDGLLRS